MKFSLLAATVSFATAFSGPFAAAAEAQSALKYPAAARGAQSDDLGGIVVADPYRWLESVGSTEVRSWVAAENALTESFLSRTARRKEAQDAVAHAWSYPTLSTPFGGGDRLFFFENSGTDSQTPLYTRDRPSAVPRLFLDPMAFSKDGLTSIVGAWASPGGKYLAYALSSRGSGWRRVRVRDARTAEDTGDELEGLRDSRVAWTRDERGFFYTRTDTPRASSATAFVSLAPDGRQRVFYHRIGKPQSDDRLMYENSERPARRIDASLTDDGQYLIIDARNGTEAANRVYFIDLDNPSHPNLGAPLVTLFDAADALYDVSANDGPIFFVRTTKNAPRGRLVAVDINTPDENHWTNVLRETYDPLVGVRRVDDRLVAERVHDAHSELDLYGLDGRQRGTVNLPGIGTVSELNPRPDNREFYFTFSSFLQAPTVYRYDLDARTVAVHREILPDSSLSQFETTQLFFTSADGTRVPMFITARRDITLDGTHPTLLVGRGAFNECETPSFSPATAAWLELGGILATANVRGGGEYGRAWHDSATGVRKHVSIDDFVSAAEFLIDQRYTRPSSLAIAGTGAGGLLAAGALTRRPELFGAAVIDAGILDMTRFSRFTVGASWIPEFGSPDRSTDLRALLGYSPLQHLRPGTRYPATLVEVGDHDDIVTPIHSYKFAAMLQSVQSLQPAEQPEPPALLRVEPDAGEGGPAPRLRQIARDADRIAFLVDALHMKR
jgi:prolyl oligopeptidase